MGIKRKPDAEATNGGEIKLPTFGKSKKANAEAARQYVESLGYKTEPYHNPKASGAAYYSHGTISINAAHKFWSDPVGKMKVQGRGSETHDSRQAYSYRRTQRLGQQCAGRRG